MRDIVIAPHEQRPGDVFLERIGADDPRVERLIRVRRAEPEPPPLPLAAGSAVYAEIGGRWGEWFLGTEGRWKRIGGFHEDWSPVELHDRASRFHVIAEPRDLLIEQIAAWFEQEAGTDAAAADWRTRAAATIRREFLNPPIIVGVAP